VERFLNRLSQVRPTPNGWNACCPAHEDTHPSLGIAVAGDGAILLKCRSKGCSCAAIVAALGLTLADLFPPLARPDQAGHGRAAVGAPDEPSGRASQAAVGAPLEASGRATQTGASQTSEVSKTSEVCQTKTPASRGRIVKTYDYFDEAGARLYQVVRYDPKAFRQRRPNGQGGWIWNLDGVRRVLYRLPLLVQADPAWPVFVVEGEKDADSLNPLQGLIATTNAGGAGKWRPEYNVVLAGRQVVLLPDNDEPGRLHMEAVARSLAGVAAAIKVLALPNLPPKGDVSDWLAQGGTAAELLRLLEQAPPWNGINSVLPQPPSANGRAEPASMAEVERRPLSWFWPGWIPLGKLTVLDGDPGLGKSTMLLDLAARASRNGHMPDAQQGTAGPTLLMSAEDDLADTIRPRLQAAGADLEQIHPFTAVDTGAGRRSPVLPDDLPILKEKLAKHKARLLIIDPFVAYLGESLDTSRDHAMRRVLFALAEIAVQAECAVVLVRHLNKGNGSKAIYRGGGSIGIVAAARSALLVAADPYDPETRVLALSKSNLAAKGKSLGYRLEPKEQGLAVVWRGEANWTADSLLEVRLGEEERSALGGACEFLQAVLADGPVAHKDLIQQAEEAGHSLITLKRAKASLGIKSKQVKGLLGRQWSWVLPGKEDVPSKPTPPTRPDDAHVPSSWEEILGSDC
jgi:hypothetical protein